MSNMLILPLKLHCHYWFELRRSQDVICVTQNLKSACFIVEGVKKGDRVSIYLPMIPELVYTMLACARIGAVHSIVVSIMMK